MPTPASSASPMSTSLLALPCSRTCSGSNPAASAIASSPAEATSQPSPSSARMRVTGAHGSALEAKCTSVRAWRLVNSSRYSRAVARRPSSSTTKAGVPNSAATSASATPPIVSLPSLVSAVRGSTSKMPTEAEYSWARGRVPIGRSTECGAAAGRLASNDLVSRPRGSASCPHADPLPRLGPQQSQPARPDRPHRARPRDLGRGGLLGPRDGGGRRPSPSRSHRLPDAEGDHPRVDHRPAPLPDRASRPEGRPRPVVARLGDRARRRPLGRHGAGGVGRGRRGRRVGEPDLPHARRRQEQPLPPRGAALRDRGRRPGRPRRGGRRCGARRRSTTPTYTPSAVRAR